MKLIRLQILALLPLLAITMAACTAKSGAAAKSEGKPGDSSSLPQVDTGPLSVIKYKYAENEITKACDVAIAKARADLDVLGTIPADQRNVDNTILSLERIVADLGDATTPLTFMGYVNVDPALREEGASCEEKMGQFYVEVFTRKDLYQAIRDEVGRSDDEKRLLSETIKGFEKNGLKLDDGTLAQVKDLKQHLASLEAEFSANLNNDVSKVIFTESELEGVSPSFLSRLNKTPDGNYIVTTKSTDSNEVMTTAKLSETRKKMLSAYLNRAGLPNTKLLDEAIQVRQQIAKLMGYKTWADYRTDGRMAKDSQSVLNLLNGLKTKLAPRYKADMDQLLAFKKELDPQATQVEAEDVSYLSYQLKKRDYSLDDDEIREYFPSDYVMEKVFEVYSELLSVRFERTENADVWGPEVRLYRIFDKNSGELIGYFHTDTVPRDGKYGHAAAFPLISGRVIGNLYSKPVASIVCNFNPPANGKPSLLNHDEVETLFHEFGHIMHQTLTKAPYASLSGSNTAQDFVEAPSQMLENWVWDPEILNRLSGHYKDTSKKLPADLLKKMIAVKDYQLGYFYTRQIMLGLFDMNIHTTEGAVSSEATYNQVYKEVLQIDALPGNHFAATFGHMMGGYDAGYYGYIWSEVYAADMFSKFSAGGLLNPVIGMEYRKNILEQGSMKDPIELVTQFLGRAPNADAFYKKLGIDPHLP